MNLEELISKYLDGEMLEQEDELLRKKLSEDATARMKFDSAVNIHIACKEDAESILPPDELVEKTEDMILMRIFASAPEPHKKRAFVWLNTPMLAAMIAFFMFVSVFEISEIAVVEKGVRSTEKGNRLTIDNSKLKIRAGGKRKDRITNYELRITNFELPIAENGEGNNKQVDEESAINNLELKIGANAVGAEGEPAVENSDITTNNDLPLGYAGNVPASASQPMAVNNIKPGVFDKNIPGIEQAKSLVAASSVELATPVLEHNSNNISGNPVKPSGIPAANFGEMIMNDFTGASDIQVASFFGTDVLRIGIEANQPIVSHFSQSVAYSVSESGRVGVELGYTEYAYNDEALINKRIKIGGGISGVESYESGYDFSVSSPYLLKMKNNKQMLWTSAFYENTLYEAAGLSIVGRIGAGGSSDGPLGYGRVFAQYAIFNGFNLTLGAEGRMFSAEIPKFVKNEDKLKTTATIIYGFQFQF